MVTTICNKVDLVEDQSSEEEWINQNDDIESSSRKKRHNLKQQPKRKYRRPTKYEHIASSKLLFMNQQTLRV